MINVILCVCQITAMMNGSNLGNSTSNNKSKDEQVVNGHDENENNPFAEYMWMENEEDFNRQVMCDVCKSRVCHRLRKSTTTCARHTLQ